MIKNETRESAHLKSRVKDLSVVPNIVSFTGLFAAVTPVAKLQLNEDGLYDPILVRDTDSLIANFGDPRIDPEKYIDLYSLMQVVGNGTSCYIAKVPSGETGEYVFALTPDKQIDTSEVSIEWTQDKINQRVWHATTTNKWLITKVNGPDADVKDTSSTSSTPFAVVVAVEGGSDTDSANDIPFTYTCTPKGDQFKYVITLAVEDDTEVPNEIHPEVMLDPSWGSEEITLTVKADSNNLVYESNSLERKYTGLKITPEPNSITWSGVPGDYILTVMYLKDPGKDPVVDANKTREDRTILAHSSMSEDISFDVSLSQAKPYSLKVFYLNVDVRDSEGIELVSSKIKLEPTTTNQDLVNNLNSSLGTYVQFELANPDLAGACEKKESGSDSIVAALLDKYVPYGGKKRADLSPQNPLNLDCYETLSQPKFHVSMNDYINTLDQYRAKKYVGCVMADLVAPVSRNMEDDDVQYFSNDAKRVYIPNQEERRALHYNLKQIACERKDTTVVLSTPYCLSKENETPFTIDDACDWVASQKSFSDLWEYGSTNTTDYSVQSFYLEIYYSWLTMQCTKIENGLAKSVRVKTAPSNIVINNILTSYRERGVHYPVAGDQYGVLPDTCTVLKNPKTKAERDQLVQYRINPIYDTGTRGVQIFGNETLNAGYTDLNAAHIARALVYIRSTIDEYTEKLKFSINSLILWDTWKNYVTNYILEPLRAVNCLAEYAVAMGTDTTSAAEIANRKINGNISLRFYQSAEIFDLTYTVYSSATTLAEATSNT